MVSTGARPDRYAGHIPDIGASLTAAGHRQHRAARCAGGGRRTPRVVDASRPDPAADQGRLRTEFLRQNAESILFYAGCPALLGRSKIFNDDGPQSVDGSPRPARSWL